MLVVTYVSRLRFLHCNLVVGYCVARANQVIDWRIVCEMTYNVSSGTLHLHFLS